MSISVPVPVQRFREEYRAEHIGPRYRGWAHFAFTSLGSLAIIAISIAMIRELRVIELVTVPAAFLFANLAEYLGHRGPMHHRRRGLGLIHRRHTLQHHRFYTREAMLCESTRDFQMILFPPVMLLFFLGGVATPVALLLYWLSTANVALLFTATAMGYFLTYEVLHLGYHLGDRSWLGRLPFMAHLRRHHMLHHDPALMTVCNFNITFPICDRIFGTSHRGAS
ncbi:MAG TPA: sterol desaturase family protein [Haliangium sp.]|nr:sterol desaturase family protein [Haliangium sp.]